VKGVSEMNKKLLIFKRKKAKELHEKGWSNRKIAGHILASKNSVGKWVQMDESEISTDNRGWEKGEIKNIHAGNKTANYKNKKRLGERKQLFYRFKGGKEKLLKTDGRKSLKVLCRRRIEGGWNGEKPGEEEKRAEQIHEISGIYADQIRQKHDEH
jgi:hypothetical protein